jgi:hypothetical protein
MTRPAAQYLTLTIGILLFAGTSSHAQVLAPGNRPIFSPWFGLYQRNGGPLDNYHTFVQPQIELSNTLQRHHVAIQRNNEGIVALGRGMSQFEEQGTVHPTGTGSVFMDYSHYYPSLGGSGRPSPITVSARHIKTMQAPAARPAASRTH